MTRKQGPALVVNDISEAARVLARGKVTSVQVQVRAPSAAQAAKIRCSNNEATDDDRVLLARPSRDGTRMLGPDEVVPCERHEGCTAIHRWAWAPPSDGDHRKAIAHSEPEVVHGCPRCEAEAEASWREEMDEG